MRIGFDTSPLHRPHPPGVVRATRGLLLALERRARIHLTRLDPPRGTALRLWRHLHLPRAVRHHDLDGIHSPVSAFPLFGPGLRVHTIHEIPWAADTRTLENSDAPHRLWAALGPVRADATLTPSRTTADHVRAQSPLSARTIHTSPWGVDPIFHATPQTDDDATLTRLDLISRPFVLAPGAVRQKKNLSSILRGMQHVPRDTHLVVTGPITPHLLATLAHHPDIPIRLPGTVDDRTLATLVRRAAAVAVLSTSEGFGLPVIESQASGTPLILPAGSTQARVANGAAVLIDPQDEYAFAIALERATTDRARLAADGLCNAAHFTWDDCAARVERIWESLA